MCDFRIAYSGFAGLNFFIYTSFRAFCWKTKLKTILHNKSIHLNSHEHVKHRFCNFFHTHEKSTLTARATSM